MVMSKMPTNKVPPQPQHRVQRLSGKNLKTESSNIKELLISNTKNMPFKDNQSNHNEFSYVKINNPTDNLIDNRSKFSKINEKIAKMPKKKNSLPLRSGKRKPQARSFISINKSRELLKAFYVKRYRELKKQATRAFNTRKIFTVYGNYKSIRDALISRGWVEKIPSSHLRRFQVLSEDTLLKLAKNGNEYERVLLSNMVSSYPSFFIWQSKNAPDKCALFKPFRNRVRIVQSFDFSTKHGLLGCSKNAYWHNIQGESELNCPRFYRLMGKNNNSEFLADYRLTQCTSLINFLVTVGLCNRLYDKINGSVGKESIDFAIEQIRMVSMGKRSAIINSTSCESNHFWQAFCDKSRKVINFKSQIRVNKSEYVAYLHKCRRIIDKLKVVYPYLKTDGFQNLWILKPGFSSRGLGIIIMKNYDNIVDFGARRPHEKYIVQKYIERPLLIYKTKFDIRQYFILTINNPITIWIYRTCYLRFSSQQFNLFDYNESIHLTNHSVQKKYQNGTRDKRLPKNNMWHLEDFKNYLNEINAPNAWNKIIYPGMKRNIIAIVLSSLDSMNLIPNSFEFFGCDFMLDESFEPILLEVNATPDMKNSTSVTAKICPIVLKDMVKVVVDASKDLNNSSTGDFELAYSVSCPDVSTNPSRSTDLVIEGSRIVLPQFKVSKSQESQSSSHKCDSFETIKKPTTQSSDRDSLPKKKSIKPEVERFPSRKMIPLSYLKTNSRSLVQLRHKNVSSSLHNKNFKNQANKYGTIPWKNSFNKSVSNPPKGLKDP